jgi:hypothetical protein
MLWLEFLTPQNVNFSLIDFYCSASSGFRVTPKHHLTAIHRNTY